MKALAVPVLVLGLFWKVSSGHDIQRTNVVRERVPVADIALIIDQSGSIGPVHYEEEIEFAKQFVASFPVAANRTRFALIEFSLPNMTRVRLNWQEGVSPQVVQSKLDEMRHAQLGTGTDFARAWTVALEQLQREDAGDRPDAPNVAVIITDGYLNSRFERNPAFAAAHKLRMTGTLLYAIHVKLDMKINRAPVDDLAEMTGNRSRVYAVEDFRRLTDELLNHITQQITDEYQDCVYEYEPIGMCYMTSMSSDCVQDAALKIIRQPQPPYGSPCPVTDMKEMPCPPSSCQDSCEQWAWDPWGECTSDNCGLNGTKSRQRHGQPPYSKLSTACQQTESRPCNPSELEPLRCSDGGLAEKMKAAGAGGSKMPVWGIVLIVLICFIALGMVVTGVILYRSPRWRMVFTPTKARRNQLPGNSDTASTHSL